METKTNRPRTSRTSNKLKLTPAETLLLWRKRLKWNQGQAAKHYRISLFEYQMAEYGKPYKGFTYPKDLALYPEPYEKCLIYRKRAKKKQTQVAKLIGCSPEWLRQMETGKINCDRLLSWWEMPF